MDKELKIFAAPLQGFTEAAWRVAHNEVFGGVDAYFTPFIRYEKGGLRNKDRREVLPENNRGIRLIPQIMASEPEELKVLTDFIISLGYKEIDLNMGCSFPLIANRGKGSGILQYPEKVAALMGCINEYSADSVSFSVKMRLGQISADEWKEILPALNASEVKPLVYNGDLCSVADINRVVEKFPDLYGVMIGRGLLADGALAAEYKSASGFTQEELYAKVRRMHSIMYERYSEVIEGGDAQLLRR